MLHVGGIVMQRVYVLIPRVDLVYCDANDVPTRDCEGTLMEVGIFDVTLEWLTKHFAPKLNVTCGRHIFRALKLVVVCSSSTEKWPLSGPG